MKSLFKNKASRELLGHEITIVLLLGLFIAIFLLMFRNSFAWFSSNKDVAGTGMQTVIKGPDYEIQTLANGTNGIYYNSHHSIIPGRDTSAVIWQMTGSNNIGNYTADDGIHPGSYGVISFYVHTFAESVDLDFTFEMLGYTVALNENNETTMTLLDQTESPAVFLNGHILLFEERTEYSDGGEVKYRYGSPILSNGDMKRVISNRTYPGVDDSTDPATVENPTLVNIYWVWPQTLSDLVDARDCVKEGINVTKMPFTYTVDDTHDGEPYAGAAYNEVLNNIRMYPGYYLKNVNAPTDEDDNGQIDDNEMISEANLVTDYDKYGDYYDLADNDMGMGKLYALIKMQVTEHVAED